MIPEQHCFEKWANFPLERERLLRLLVGASAPAMILSGDRHLAEVSKISPAGAPAPLLELTSSGMNSAGAGKGEPNRHRALPENVREDNFATVSIDWRDSDAYVELAIRGVDGMVLQKLDARFEEAGRAAAAKSAR